LHNQVTVRKLPFLAISKVVSDRHLPSEVDGGIAAKTPACTDDNGDF
jgi:hypothetical protein